MKQIILLILIVIIVFLIYKCSNNIETYSPFVPYFAKCDTAHIRDDPHLCKNQHYDEISCENSIYNCKWDSKTNSCKNITSCQDLSCPLECNVRSKDIGYLDRIACYWDNIFQKCFKA